ncbi:MAG: AAA family ATPase [Nitriliruptoraceae bacterium]
MVDSSGEEASSENLLGDHLSLSGEVLGIWFADASTGFGVVEFAIDGDADGIRCSGPVATLSAGQRVTVVGSWGDHPRYGPTFEALYWQQSAPQTADELEALLVSDAFADVPRRAVERALATFGDELADVASGDPERLAAEAGIDAADAQALHKAWLSGRVLADFFAKVAPLGWPIEAARQAHRTFGDQLLDIASSEPYTLFFAGRITFSHVDRLAAHLGIASHDGVRLAAGATAAVRQLRAGNGHQHVPRSEAVGETRRILATDAVLAVAATDQALTGGWLAHEVIDGIDVVAEPEAFATERSLAEHLLRLGQATSRVAPLAAKAAPAFGLTEEQSRAVIATFTHAVSVLTGGPGTGKTRTVQEVVAAASKMNLQVALCAPTGRAAKRLEEVVAVGGVTATTIHRLLEARPDGHGDYSFRFGADERLPFDLVIADEVSMCDTWLARSLVAAIDDGAHLMLVGDPDQLPSVGPGDVLGDLIRSGRVHVTTLIEIHRQAADSRIVTLATDVRDGRSPALRPVDHDVFLADERDHDRIIERVVKAVATRAPERFSVAVDEVQVLCPSYRGPVGVDRLNQALKGAINPPGGGPQLGGFDVGDRVMQTRNDADLDVANGDVGHVVDLDTRAGSVTIRYPRHEVTYDRAQLRDVTLAWAVTVHKAQGGEWPVVVLVVDRSHRAMMWRNLVYTAITRAQQALIIVGDPSLIVAATGRDGPGRRWTGLAWRLAHGAPSSSVVHGAAPDISDNETRVTTRSDRPLPSVP